MVNTRFMDRLFSATEEGDEELTEQVANDIESARENGSVDTDEVTYEDNGDGRVAITDKENGEVTMAERAEDGNYDLYPAQLTENLEGYAHPEMDGVTPGQQYGVPMDNAWDHLQSGMISPNVPGYGLNPMAGNEPSVEELAQAGPDALFEGEGEREFSVYSDNAVVQRIFSDQAYMERLFSEVIESEETAKVGDLKIEKISENSVVVTNLTTGDQAKITLDGGEMEVTELDSKNFCGCGEEGCEGGCCGDEFEQLHVVGVDPMNHVIVDAPEYDEESAQELCAQLSGDGVQGVQIFASPEEARDYAMSLLENLGAESEDDIEEPEQVEYSDHTIYVTRFFSNSTDFMTRCFSEAASDIEATQEEIEDAIEKGEEIENDTEIITPIDSTTAVVEDKENGEFTKVTLAGEDMNLDPISREEAEALTENLAVESDEDDDDDDSDDEESEKAYSELWFSDDLTKMFSENEDMNDYMIRMFSGDADEEAIADAIESGDEIEKDGEIITPIDSKTAVIEDKNSGDFTKATIDENGDLDIKAISEEEAEELTSNVVVDEDSEKDEDEEKAYSELWYSDDLTRVFSENEDMNDYMIRMFSGDADEEAIADAIENGDQIENETEVITPIDSKTAVIEDKKSGDFSKATIDSEGDLDIKAISEEEADKLTENLAVDNDGEDEEEKAYCEYYFGSNDPVMTKFFAEMMPQQVAAPQGVQQLYDENGNPVPVVLDESGQPQIVDQQPQGDPNMMGQQDPNMMAPQQAPQGPSVETIEDKAMAAVQQIQAAAAEAEATIMNAKAAPVQGQEQDLQEAQFSEVEDGGWVEDTLVTWLGNNRY